MGMGLWVGAGPSLLHRAGALFASACLGGESGLLCCTLVGGRLDGRSNPFRVLGAIAGETLVDNLRGRR